MVAGWREGWGGEGWRKGSREQRAPTSLGANKETRTLVQQPQCSEYRQDDELAGITVSATVFQRNTTSTLTVVYQNTLDF